MTDSSINVNVAQLQHETFDVKAWLNGVLPQATGADGETSDDARVSKLLTRLQVHQQEVSTSLEDLISQALVRLPRTALEVERLTTDTLQLSKQLGHVVAAVEPQLAALPAQAKEIAKLDRARAKLVRCSQSLQKAKMLSLQLEELESSAKTSSSPSTTKDGGVADVRVESFANAISEIQESLRELQRIDPSYGAEVQARVHGLENEVQRSIERECLDLLRRQDRRRAPTLLSTLRKIGREGAVMDEFVALSVKQRKEQFLSDLRANQHPGGKSSTAELVSILGSHYKGIARIISREVAYIREVFEGDATAADSVARRIGKAFAEPGATNLLATRLKQLPTNADLVLCIATLGELKDAEGRTIDYALEDGLATFVPLVSSFVQREAEAVSAAGSDIHALQDPKHFAAYLATLDASIDRCAKFLPSSTLPTHLPFVGAALRDRLAALVNPTGALSERLVQHSLLSGPVKGTLASFEANLQSHLHDELVALGKLQTSDVKRMDELLIECNRALSTSIEKSERGVGDALLVPVTNRMAAYEEWTFWNALTSGSQTTSRQRAYASYSAGEVSPSDIMRGVCEALMEVPMMLEAVNVDSAEMQLWLSRVVDASVSSLRATLSKIVIRGPSAHVAHGLDQMATDVEYYHNVLNAVSEGSFQEIADTKDRLRSTHKKWLDEPSSTAATDGASLSVAVAEII